MAPTTHMQVNIPKTLPLHAQDSSVYQLYQNPQLEITFTTANICATHDVLEYAHLNIIHSDHRPSRNHFEVKQFPYMPKIILQTQLSLDRYS